NKALMQLLRRILAALQAHYGAPVDIEYTINFNESGDFVVNLLQCRSLHVWQAAASQSMPQIPGENMLFKAAGTFMGNSAQIGIDAVVYVDAQKYHDLPYATKGQIAGLVGKINRHYRDGGKKLMLVSPGRIGTSSPELGV